MNGEDSGAETMKKLNETAGHFSLYTRKNIKISKWSKFLVKLEIVLAGSPKC
jgi:hypothetical protein